ncbi:CHAD domain-containing protein [Sinomonas sp. P10A9]|uniref:CHAD domain-containing protein n=1 Tax=Sinomonas puerhi TaxID=3238584 RepID=A0AB39L7L8_9MICC
MATQEILEVERKYNVDDDAAVQPLAGLPGVDRVGPPVTHHLVAVYFDTHDFTLATHGITLRHRTGGSDAGWHLKLPEGAARREIREPLGVDSKAVPERLRRLVAVHVRAAELVPVAQLTTRRTASPLLTAGGEVLAEFSDDRVESQAPPGIGQQQRWREWEIELVDGTPDLLTAADEMLASNGVHPAELASKLARALGPSLPQKPKPAAAPKRKGQAGVVLLTYLQRHVDALKTVDPGVRLDAEDAVHQLRVSARRMRSALATFKKLVDAPTADRLRAELQWLAGTVGQARDVEVMRERLTALAAGELPELLVGPVAQRIQEESDSRYRQAHDVGLAAMDSERYFHLLDSLDAFVADPPLTDRAHQKASKTVARHIAKDIERLKEAVRAAEDADDADSSGEAAGEEAVDAALHEVRKSAKRLRYAAEAATPVLGKRASRLAKSAERIQETLGTVQDSVVSRAHLLDLAAQAHDDGDSAFSFGRLHALEQQRAAEARAQFVRDWADFIKNQ